MKVYLKYTFIFETEKGWPKRDDFDNALSSFFIAHGLEPQLVKGVNENSEDIIVYLEKIENDNQIIMPKKIATPNQKIFDKALKGLNKPSGRPSIPSGRK